MPFVPCYLPAADRGVAKGDIEPRVLCAATGLTAVLVPEKVRAESSSRGQVSFPDEWKTMKKQSVPGNRRMSD
jgi:hypothetical protein